MPTHYLLHGHFSAYHDRFGHEKEMAIASIWLSKRKGAQVAFMVQKVIKAVKEISRTPEGALIFAEWAPATGLFRRPN